MTFIVRSTDEFFDHLGVTPLRLRKQHWFASDLILSFYVTMSRVDNSLLYVINLLDYSQFTDKIVVSEIGITPNAHEAEIYYALLDQRNSK